MDPPERNTSVEKTVRTVCDPNCHAAPRCGILAHVKDGKIQRIEPAEFPLQEYSKRICLMGTTRLEYVYHKDRLKFPFKREGPRGQGSWKRISWEEAYKIISNGLRQVAEKYGPEAVYFYQGSGCQGVLTQSSPVRFASVFGGTTRAFGGVDYGVPKGLEYMFGVSAQTFFKAGGHEWADCLNSKMILLWGFNAAETQIVDYRFIQEAQKLGCKIVYVDPNRTITAKKADEWISPRGGSDCALALSMMHTIISRRLLDTSFLLNHTSAPLLVKQDNGRLLCNSELNEKNSKGEYVVFDEKTSQVIPANQSTQPSLSGQFSVTSRGGDEINCTTVFTRLEEVASSYTKEKAEAITQVPASTIEKFAVEYATTKPAAIRVGYGVDRWYYSDLLARALGSLASLTGNIGIPGGGISVRSGTYNIPINISHFKYPAGKPKTLDQIEAFNAILTGKPFPVKALWLQSSNIFNQPAANRKKVVDTLIPQIDFMVVTDHFMTTTAQFADIVLPAASMFEKTDLVAGVFLQLQQKAIPPLGESKSDFDIFKRLAEKMGYSELFARSDEDYLREIVQSDDPMLKDITYDKLKESGVIFPNRPKTPYVAFSDLRFNTPSGRIELYKEELLEYNAELPYYREPIEASPTNQLTEKYPLNIIFPHTRFRIHSTFANMPTILKVSPEPMVHMNPLDAQQRNIKDGDVVLVFNDRGKVAIKVELDKDLRKGMLAISEGWWVDQFIDGDPYTLTHDQYSPTAQNYAYYDCLVQVRKV